MEADWHEEVPRWQGDVGLLLLAAVFLVLGLMADGGEDGVALIIIGWVVVVVAIVRVLGRIKH
jgi:hypothetical protein